MSVDFIEILRREFGGDRIITDESRLVSYATDESEAGPFLPQAALVARSAVEVETLLRLAAEYRFPVTPRGLGTGKSGGALPVAGGVILAMDRMNRVLDIDGENFIAVVEPGVITATLQDEAWGEGMFYPPDPASLESCSIGGNVSENAGGPRAFRYGVTSHYVLGMDVVVMGGRRFFTGHNTIKGVSGYSLPGLLTGSEGTLGVFTKLVMRLVPRPREPGLVVPFFDSLEKAGDAVTRILKSGLTTPMALELLDHTSLEHIRGIDGFDPPRQAAGAVICEIEGLPEDDALMDGVFGLMEELDPLDVQVALDQASARRIWSARRQVSTRLKEAHAHKFSDDVTVPRSALPLLLHKVEELASEHDLIVGCYGHAGDGNLHVNLLADDESPHDRFEAALRELLVLVVSLGGTISGEHGIGITKKRFMSLEHSPAEMDMMLAVKKAWDPYNLLNPGKIFPDG